MAGPYSLHTDASLAYFLADYKPGDFYAGELSPIVETDKVSNVYTRYLRADVNNVYNDIIGPKSQAGEVDYERATASYTCQMRATKAVINWATEMNADEPQNVRERYAELAMDMSLLGREVRVASIFTTAANYAAANQIAAGTAWSSDSANPVKNIHDAIAAIAPGNMSRTKRVGVCSLEVGQALLRHPALRGGGHVNAVVEKDAAARLLGLDELFISDTTYNTANLGATPSYSRVWGSNVFMVARVPRDSNMIGTSTFSCTFRWLNGGEPLQVRRWDEPSLGYGGSTAIQVELADDEVVVQSDMASIISGVL
jgi:hypothetical protein